MICITITYAKGSEYKRNDIQKICYNGIMDEEIPVEGDDLLKHHFPMGKTLWIHSSEGTESVSSDGIRSIFLYDV